jgi:Ni,Fe-hydrogenase III small subunit/ferredoxin
MPWVPRGLRSGTLTTGWPKHADDYFDGFPASIDVNQADNTGDDPRVEQAALRCPTGAITVGPEGVLLDRGRCILCERCTRIAPEVFRLRGGSDTARLAREQLIVGASEETPEELRRLQNALAAKVRHLRRSVHIRHIDTGSDGADEWEIQALAGPVYDIHRLGIYFTVSPRHADILLATGIGTAGMAEAVRTTRQGMPEPVVVIATGAGAISGGILGGGYAGGSGVGGLLEVDVWVPGSPASPFSLMHGILLALGRLPNPADRDEGGRG